MALAQIHSTKSTGSGRNGLKAQEPLRPATRSEVEAFAARMKALKRQGKPEEIKTAVRAQRAKWEAAGFDSPVTERLFATIIAKHAANTVPDAKASEIAVQTTTTKPARYPEAPRKDPFLWFRITMGTAVVATLIATCGLIVYKIRKDFNPEPAAPREEITRSKPIPEIVPIDRNGMHILRNYDPKLDSPKSEKKAGNKDIIRGLRPDEMPVFEIKEIRELHQ